MLLPIKEKIAEIRSSLLDLLEYENKTINFRKRWFELDDFRESLSKYVDGYDGSNSERLTSKVSILCNGHILDHHVLGYFAPMEFKRWGFCQSGTMIKRNHVEQIKILSDFFTSYGVRFIYVPLPCKVAIDPAIAVADDVIPMDGLIIPQWRKVLLDMIYEGIEIVDCYTELRNKNRLSFTRNHHISPVGAVVIANKVSEYIRLTTLGLKKEPCTDFAYKNEVLGSPVLLTSGNDNSIELGEEYFESTRVFLRKDGFERPYMGRNRDSEIVIIGDCNLQSYRGTGADITAQLSGRLKYPIGYLGRYLPFARYDSIDKLPAGILYGKSIVIYIGFISGSFVRANREDDVWSTNLPEERIFMKQ